MSMNYSVTLPNGVVISAPDHNALIKVLEVLDVNPRQLLDPAVYYKSKTKGWSVIKEMSTQDLADGILELYQAYLQEVKATSKTGKEFLDGVTSFPVWIDDPNSETFVSMLNEISKRPEM